MKETTKPRDSFATKWGFRLACIGSAVGMGNIWLFPYRLGQLGARPFSFPISSGSSSWARPAWWGR